MIADAAADSLDWSGIASISFLGAAYLLCAFGGGACGQIYE
jgi:hypothetical protein